MKLDKIQKALASLQDDMINRNPTLLVAKDTSEVIGITTVFPQLRSLVVSKEQFIRSNMAKTWQGKIEFLHGEQNGITQETRKTSDTLHTSQRGELSLFEESSEGSKGEEPVGASGSNRVSVQEKQKLSKTGSKK
jgi:hypothetical protein